MNSYIISAAEGRGVYRHIRISSDATLLDLHKAIVDAYGIDQPFKPFFTPQNPGKSKKDVKFGTNNTKTTIAMRDSKLKEVGFDGKSALIYTLAQPRLTFTCRTITHLNEQTPSPQVIRSSGGQFALNAVFEKMFKLIGTKDDKLTAQLNMVKDFVELPKESWKQMAEYYLAAGNLYGVAPLDIIHEKYNLHNPNVSFYTFSKFAITFSNRENMRFSILDEKGKTLTNDDHEGRKAAFIADYTVMENNAFNYVRSMQEDKPWFLPPEEEFLRYADESYVEENEQFHRLRTHLLSLGLAAEKAKNCMFDVVDSTRIFEEDPQVIFNILEHYKIRLKNLKAHNDFLKLYWELSQNTRSHLDCGYTRTEMSSLLQKQSGEKAPKTFICDSLRQGVNRHEVDFFQPMGEIMPFPLPRAAEKKPGRNEPCPCGSGKKYKRCCGKTGADLKE